MQEKFSLSTTINDIVQGLQKRAQWMGHEALIAEDGASALALIDREAPDLILLDIEMPGLSGLAGCADLRSGS